MRLALTARWEFLFFLSLLWSICIFSNFHFSVVDFFDEYSTVGTGRSIVAFLIIFFSSPPGKHSRPKRESRRLSVQLSVDAEKSGEKFLPRLMSMAFKNYRKSIFYCDSCIATIASLPGKSQSRERGLLHKKGICIFDFNRGALTSRERWTNSIAQRRIIFVCISWMSKWEGITMFRWLQSQQFKK